MRHKGSWSAIPLALPRHDDDRRRGASQCVGPSSDEGHCNWTIPEHRPGQSDVEYRTEASMYVIVSSPMMVGTDLWR